MHDENDDDLSLTEILYALIPALVLYLETILANPNHTPSPALRRLARTIQAFRTFATLLGLDADPAVPTPISLVSPRAARQANPRSTIFIQGPTPGPWYTPAGLGLVPEPTRTLEL